MKLGSRVLALVTVIFLLSLLLTACGTPSTTPTPLPTPKTEGSEPAPYPLSLPANSAAGKETVKTYAGWAIDAYPDMSKEQMTSDLRRMKQAGANIIWISHSNPAHSFVAAREVGINPAVWWAHTDPSRFPHQEAVQIVEATRQMLQVCRELGLKAVISAGYHTQMGDEWNKAHPDHLRQKPDGTRWHIVKANEPYASIYSPQVRQDLKEYYGWVAHWFVLTFPDVVTMVNLGDEPLGGDYSKWADSEFQKRTGYSFAQVGNDSQRQEALGEFQAGVVADFMKLGANSWQELAPDVKVTMSFDGGAMREDIGFPPVERLFREAPANFVLTWDMYPRDRGTLDIAVNREDISRLFHLTRLIAGYSVQYQRPVWFWSAANSWGLGQTAHNPGTISDAQANLLYLALLMRQQGGLLQGIAVWNYNIRGQGLYNYAVGSPNNKATWNEDQMFERVSANFELVRQIMRASWLAPGSPEMVFLRSPAWQARAIGQNFSDYYQPQIEWANFDYLLQSDIATAEIARWPEKPPANWSKVRFVTVLSPLEFLSPADIAGLRNWVTSGGTLIGSLGVIEAVTGSPQSVWSNGLPQAQNFGKGRVFASRESVADLFDSAQRATHSQFWQTVFGARPAAGGYVVHTPELYLHYNIETTPATAPWPTASSVWRYNTNGTVNRLSEKDWSDAPLIRSEYVLAYL